MINLDHKRGRLAATLVNQLSGLQKQGNSDVLIPLNDITLKVNGALDKTPNATKGAFLQEIRALPVLIHQSGLLQSLAFLDSKVGARRLARLCLLHWLRHANSQEEAAPGFSENSCNEAKQFYELLLQRNPIALRADTAEAQAILVWLKQFAEVHFKQFIKEDE